MDGEDKRKSGSEGKPLLAFSDAPVSDSKKSRSTEDQASPTPPWTPPASPRERAQYYRSHQSASSALTDEEIAGLREIGRDAASSEDKASPSDKEQPASDADENWPRRSMPRRMRNGSL